VVVRSEGGELLARGSDGLAKALDPSQQYDTVVSINVLEHVQDAFAYINGMYAVLKPGGYLIFHDRYYDESTIIDGDMYHPVRISRAVLDRFLAGFEIVYNNCNANYAGRKGEQGYYVIARKL
jgi:SAM-dependent methyltransferase